MNTATATLVCFPRAFPLALPEPVDSQLRRLHGVADWMLVETFEAFLDYVHGPLKGDWLGAYEQLRDALPDPSDKAAWNLFWHHKVRQVGRYPDGRIYSDEMESCFKVLNGRCSTAMRLYTEEQLRKRHTARYKRQWARENRIAA